jgi:TetR/AcrR family transcriptional regulator
VTRSERTRNAVLEAAENLFAERGFAATRLEDIAERVGIKRASIVYYFKDKRELYDAVLGNVLGSLHQALATEISRHENLAMRIEAAVSVWVDCVGSRPTLARLILREVANATPEKRSLMLQHTAPFQELVRKEFMDRPDRRDVVKVTVDPIHIASIVAGATVFYVAAMPNLVSKAGLDPTTPEHIDDLKQELLRIVRQLLETRGTPA